MRARGIVAVLALILGATPGMGAQEAILTFDPPAWSVDVVTEPKPRTLAVTVTNRGASPATVSFTPGCDCLTVSPGARTIAGGGAGVFTLGFDPTGYAGKVELDFVVRTDVEGLEKALFAVTADVRIQGPGVEPVAAAAPERADVSLPFYYSAGCRTCERLLAQLLPELSRSLGRTVSVVRRNILDPAVYEEYTALLEKLGQTERAYPALIVGGVALQGEREIRRDAGELLLEGGGAPAAAARRLDLRVLPILAAGLLDGVNPCAFSTLVFLVSSLMVAGRGRREVLAVGALFAAGVFATYYAIGLGAFSALRAAASFPVVAAALRWVLFGALLVLAGLSLYDYFMARGGEPGRMLLQLPTALKRQIHRTVRGGSRAAALGASAAAMGVLVSVFELACTGQVYLPAIGYMVRARAGATAYLYLLVYNLGFIAPLIAVFVLAYLGLSSQSMARIVRSSLGAVKLGLAGLFMLMAALTLFT